VLRKIQALPPEVLQTLAIPNCVVFGGDWRGPEDGVLSADAGAGPKLLCTAGEVSRLSHGTVSVDLFIPTAAKTSGGYCNAGMLLKVSEAGDGASNFKGYEIAASPEGHINIGLHQHNFKGLKRIPCRIPVCGVPSGLRAM
jgi:hypothetical protein